MKETDTELWGPAEEHLRAQEPRFLVVVNHAEHSGDVVEVNLNNQWSSSNPNGWTNQAVTGPHGTIYGEYETREEAAAVLDKYLECDSIESDTYCYSHNRI